MGTGSWPGKEGDPPALGIISGEPPCRRGSEVVVFPASMSSPPLPPALPAAAPPLPSRAVLWTLLLTSTPTVMAGAIIAPALPTMEEVFRTVDWVEMGVRLVLTMPALFIVLGAPAAGWVADRYGRVRLLVGATILFAGAGGAGLVLNTLPGILVSRALLGLGVAGVMTAVTTLIGDYYQGLERARVLGAQAAFMGMGGVVFTTGGGFLAALHWRGPFAVYLAMLLVLPAILRILRDPEGDTGGHPPAPSPAGGASSGLSAPPPDLPGGIPLAVAAPVFGVAVLMQVLFYTIPVQLPFHLESVWGRGPRVAGVAIATSSLFFSLGSLLSARINRGWSQPAVVARGLFVTGAGFAIVTTAPGVGALFPGLALAGAGIGIVLPGMSVWLMNEVPARLRGRAMGGFTTSIFLGQFLSPILAQPFIATGGPAAAYLAIAVILPVLGVGTMLAGWMGKRRRSRLPGGGAPEGEAPGSSTP